MKAELIIFSARGGSSQDTLATFIAKKKEGGLEFGMDRGFVLASETTTIASAKRSLDQHTSCQDIFVNKDGKPDDPLMGWISNVRLAKYLEA